MQITQTMENATSTLIQRWNQLRANDPKLRIRNAAQGLGVSEVELLVTRLGDGVTRLRAEFPAILGGVVTLGRVMALTRNEDVVHERKGTYLNASLDKGPVGLFVGAEIDLRIFWSAWSSAFAVQEEGRDGPRFSLQFFAKDGSAIHKIYLLPESDAGAYHDLVERFREKEQEQAIHVVPFPPPPAERPDAEVDVAAFRSAWLALKDTHDFHMLVHGNRLSRTQALRLAPEGYAVPVPSNSLRKAITVAAAQQVPIMVFVGDRGMLQIHTGTVEELMDIPGWFNVIDPDFNLHVREAAIASAWVVRKPTDDGMVTAIECYNTGGEQLIQVFGKRKPGLPELESWRDIVAGIEQEVAHA
ncbi:MAG: ChuX/HutX family heme-like substrate-binding protein [Flavobacteriales bacterium]